MLKINRKVEYALIALKYMTGRPNIELTTAREICDHFKIPFDTTAKVLQIMNHHKIVSSVKGLKGGYAMNRSLEEISYGELSRIIEGIEIEHYCDKNAKKCNIRDICNIVGPVENLNKLVTNYLEKITLKALLQENNITGVNL